MAHDDAHVNRARIASCAHAWLTAQLSQFPRTTCINKSLIIIIIVITCELSVCVCTLM